MPKCPACSQQAQNSWKFCPECGMRRDSSAMIIGYSLDRARYLWERQQGGKTLFNNFGVVKTLGVRAWSNPKIIRHNLHDREHINLLNLRKFSLPYLNSDQTYELYAIGKLIGYYNTTAGLSIIPGFLELIDKLNKTGSFWTIFENKIYQKRHADGWAKVGAGSLSVAKVDRAAKKVVYHLGGCPSSIVHASLPVCFMEVGCLSGMGEALFGGIWDGKETKCQVKGDDCNEVEIYLHEKEETPQIDVPTKEDYDRILTEIVETTVNKTPIRSKELTDYFDIVVDQVMNYYLLSLSPGHAVMSKYAGRICGERIAEKAQLEGQDAALTYLEDMFLYLKAGILHSEKAGDRVIIRMKESVYASGVSNIHQNLCIFLAGIIEGALNKATGQKWDVSEMKCLASGFPECEFWCKKI